MSFTVRLVGINHYRASSECIHTLIRCCPQFIGYPNEGCLIFSKVFVHPQAVSTYGHEYKVAWWFSLSLTQDSVGGMHNHQNTGSKNRVNKYLIIIL